MLFNSPQFGIFLLIVFFTYLCIRENRRLRHFFLLSCSFFFYMCWNEKYILLLIFSTILDFFIGKALYKAERPRVRKLLLSASVLGNLAILGTFKYFNFFSENVNALGSLMGMEPLLPALNVLLPVGISFYTFQTMSYTIEIYQRKLEPCHSIIEFALFVSFFPQLVAGPIVRASQFLPQLETTPKLDDNRLSLGLYSILKGLFKKIIIADYVGLHLVDKVYGNPSAYEGITVLIAIYGFFLQIYGDFSGYTDIAIGSARLLGFELPVNFRAPFKARSVRDFWTRWHITMSSWFRDFVYYPLGGSRKGEARTMLNLAVSMFLVGLWHGASWTFIIWGLINSVYVWAERMVEKLRGPSARKRSWYRDLIAIFIAYHLSAFATVFFRAKTVSDAGIMYARLFSFKGLDASISKYVLAAMIVGYATHLMPEQWKLKVENVFTASPAFAQAFASVAVLGVCIFLHLEQNPFIYFQF